MVNQVEPLFLPVKDAAKVIGVGQSKFYELVADKKIQLVKVGRKSLAPLVSLRQFADNLTNSAA